MRKLKLLLTLCMVTIAASASKTVYLAPGAWDVANTTEYFALWAWPEGGDGQWAVREDVGLGVYKFTFDDSCQKMFFLRTSADEDYWNNEWARTGEITVPSTDDVLYTIASTEDNSYSESSYSFYTSIRALSEGKYYLKNVASGKFWGAGNSWGTQASLVEHPEYVTLHPYISDGHYTLESQVSNGGTAYFFEGDYMDNGNAYWLRVAKKDDNKFTFSKADGTDNTYFGYDGSTTVLGKGLAATSENALWEVYSEAEMIANLSAATANSPLDATFFILDQGFGRNNRNSGSWKGTGLTKGGDNSNLNVQAYMATFDTYQELTGLPKGTYKIDAQAAVTFHDNRTIKDYDGNGYPLIYAGDATSNFNIMSSGDQLKSQATLSTAFSAGNYKIEPIFVTVSDAGTLTVGAKSTRSDIWAVWDNFVLTYFGDCTIAEAQNAAHILDYNEALANAQAAALKPMAASAKSTLEGIIDANDDLDTATATAQELIDATTALNNAVTAAQPSIDLYESIKSLETQLKTQLADFSVDAKYNAGEYTALSEVYADYNAFAIAKLSTDANTDYTSVIVNPSFEFGNTLGWTYDPSNDHGAKTYNMSGKDGEYLFNIWSAGHAVKQTIVGLPKGLYELKAVVANSSDGDPAKVYLLANENHEGITCNTNGDTGVEGSIKGVVGDDGVLVIGAVGSNNDADRSYSEVGVWWYKVDNFRLTYLGDVVSDEDATAILASVPEGKMKADVQTALTVAKEAFEANKTTDNYSALQTAITNANTSIAAYANAKTQLELIAAELESTNVYDASMLTAMQTAYTEGTMTDADAAAIKFLAGWRGANTIDDLLMSYWDENPENWGSYHVNTWSTEGNNDGSNFKVPFYEYWTDDANSLGAKTLTATVPGLTANADYKVTATVRVRQANDKTKVDNSITLQVGEGTAVDVTTGSQISSSQFYIAEFAAKGATDGEGNLTIKFNVAAESNISWLSFKNVKYTKVEYASSDDYTALATAITDAEAKTLGFEAGEYAPYNNVAALEALAAAKAIDQTADNEKADVEAATNALTAAVWTSNEAEVNAFFKGDFADYAEDTATPLDYTPAGWTATANFRLMLKNTETYPGLNDASAKSAVMAWSGGITYGETAGYEMPLKANTVYKLSFKAAGWNNETRSGITVSVLNAEDGLAATDLGTADRDIKGNDQNTAGMTSYVKFFKTGAAGNYVFHVQSGNNMVLTDFDLRMAPVYAVVGSDKDETNAAIFSGKWDVATQTDIMTFEDGVFTKTYADQELDAQTIAFKVIEKASVEATEAGLWHGNSDGSNVEMTIAEAGKYNITITFDGLNVSYECIPTTETFTVGATGWATAITHNAVDFTGVEGLKAYTATVAEGVVTLAEAGAVPAGTALVLKGATKAVPIVESAAAVENDLKGSNEYDYVISDEMDAQYNFYGLTVSGETAKFAKLNKGTIQPGKAYLQIEKPATGGARELKVVFAGDATGIDAVVAEKAVEGIYNMNGQRVTAPAKGLYIVNGKKVILK